jgi:hypothetical protein
MVIIFVAMVTASHLLTDILRLRSTDEVKLEEISSGVSRYLTTTFSAFCSQGKGRLYTETIRHIMTHSLDNFSAIYVIDYTLSMTKL